MASKMPGELSPEGVARANRRRIAAEEGKQAMVDVERDAVAIRANMKRLRALREAEEASKRLQASLEPAPKSKAKRAARKPAKPKPVGRTSIWGSPS
jgi:hypothetical protein